MDYFIPILLIIVGLVFIVKGGDWFVDAVMWIAKISHIPSFIIGATLVSLCTTLPELLVSSFAAAKGSADMAVGNAIGSVTANTGLILALTLTFAPFTIERKDYMLRSSLLIGSIALLFGLCATRVLNPWLSLLMFVPLVVFMWDNLKKGKQHMLARKEADNVQGIEVVESEEEKELEEAPKKDKKTVITNIVKFIVGVVGIVWGSDLLVDYASELATLLGISEGIIAVTIVAIGTSLPELVTTVTALVKKDSSLSAGNIIGANLIDICLILPICAIISAASGATGLPVSLQSMYLDFPFCLGVSLIALAPALITKKFRRWQGITMLCAYVAYIVLCILMTKGIIFA